MAFSIRNLKIRQQIQLVTLPPLFVLLCSIAFLFYAYWMSRYMDRTVRQSEEAIVGGERLLRYTTEAYLGVRGYLITRQTERLRIYEETLPLITTELQNLRGAEEEHLGQLATLESIQKQINRWQSEWAIPAIARVRRGETVEVSTTLETGEKGIEVLRNQIKEFIEVARKENQAILRRNERTMSRVLYMALGTAMLVTGIVLFHTREVAGLLEQPIRQLIEASERISQGDFNPTLPRESANEFGVLSRSFARMTATLRQDREELAALNRFFEAVTQSTLETEIYDHVLHLLKTRFHPRQAIIFSLNTSENYLEAVASLIELPESLRAWPVIEEKHNCKAVRMGRPFRVNDVTTEPLCPAKFVPPSEGSYYCGPLIAGGIIIGAVRLEGAKGYWTQERETLLESYLSGAAIALSNLRLLESMRQRATVDELTGLYNRRFFEDFARKQMAISQRRSTSFGVIMMDLDHFKSYNDEFGHEVGDRILRQFAKTVTHAIRETNVAARFGGEEFVVILPETGVKECMIVAERIRSAVTQMPMPAGTDRAPAQITVSLGVAVYPDHGRTFEELLLASDRALYESKRAGRNRSTLYVPQEETPA
jgi:diguanylate cyclase (GGDEF)-like protein